MTPEMPKTGRAPNETDRPSLAEIAELVRRSDGALLEAVLATDATSEEIGAAVAAIAAGDGIGPPSGPAAAVWRLLHEHEQRTTPAG